MTQILDSKRAATRPEQRWTAWMLAATITVWLAACVQEAGQVQARTTEAAPESEMTSAIEPSVTWAAPGSVNIYRDQYGVPHLYAEREEDGFWGHGYTTAEDRLEGVLLYYLSLKGELASAFGSGEVDLSHAGRSAVKLPLGVIPDTVASDISARQWRTLEDARENFSALPPQLQANLSAYMAGIKQYMDDHPEQVPDWAPSLEPALPLAGAGAFMLNDSMRACDQAIAVANSGDSAMEGSNIWAFPAERMVEGAAVFESDSHGVIEWAFGTFLSPTRVNAGAMDAWLLDVPGMMMGIKGHSRDYAWGWAEGARRPADCIVLETVADDPLVYTYDGEPLDLVTMDYVIEVKGQEAVKGTFEYTRHNGVLSPVVQRQGGRVWAISSAYMHRSGFQHKQFRDMLLASDAQPMRKAMAQVEIYPANLIYAGSDGSITFIRPGRIPVRPAGFDGAQPVDGNRSAGAWQGIHPLEKLVQVTNPPQQYLVNNNVSPENMFADPFFNAEDYPPGFAFDGAMGSRQQRAIDLFEGGRQLTFADVMDFVRDDFVVNTDRWGAVIASAVEARTDSIVPEDPGFDEFLTALTGFDGYFAASSRAALYFALLRERLRAGSEDQAAVIESALNQGEPLSDEQQAYLVSLVAEVYTGLGELPGAGDQVFGDVFRIGRGGTSSPSHGYSLRRLPAAPAHTDAVSLWAAYYGGADENGYRWSRGGSRHPFLVQFTKPIRSYSLAVFGASDVPNSPHYSDQSVRVAEEGLHSNFFEPEELAGVVRSVRTVPTGTDPAAAAKPVAADGLIDRESGHRPHELTPP